MDTQGALLETKKAFEALRVSHVELVEDCNAARASLLSELLGDLGPGKGGEGHLEAVAERHGELLKAAGGKEGEESAIAKKARRAIDCGDKDATGKARALDPANYQVGYCSAALGRWVVPFVRREGTV